MEVHLASAFIAVFRLMHVPFRFGIKERNDVSAGVANGRCWRFAVSY